MIKNSKYDVKECYYDTDYWAGGVKKCADMGLHLPDMMTLANIANSKYGTTLIGPYTLYVDATHGGDNCKEYIKTNWDGGSSWRVDASDSIICNANTAQDPSSGFAITGYYWSSSEYSSVGAYHRRFLDDNSYWSMADSRYHSGVKSLCVGD